MRPSGQINCRLIRIFLLTLTGYPEVWKGREMITKPHLAVRMQLSHPAKLL